jgi:hypothetical protein
MSLKNSYDTVGNRSRELPVCNSAILSTQWIYTYANICFTGKGVNIWDTQTHNHPEDIYDFSNGDVAADSYHKYAEDIELLKDLGVGMNSLLSEKYVCSILLIY